MYVWMGIYNLKNFPDESGREGGRLNSSEKDITTTVVLTNSRAFPAWKTAKPQKRG